MREGYTREHAIIDTTNERNNNNKNTTQFSKSGFYLDLWYYINVLLIINSNVYLSEDIYFTFKSRKKAIVVCKTTVAATF